MRAAPVAQGAWQPSRLMTRRPSFDRAFSAAPPASYYNAGQGSQVNSMQAMQTKSLSISKSMPMLPGMLRLCEVFTGSCPTSKEECVSDRAV